jgi:hypothetical protein
MANPWDIPPYPTEGDETEDITYAGVGRVLSHWEMIEVELSHIYSLFLDRFEEIEALREYGVPRIFEERIKGLIAASEHYFRAYPSQDLESEFSGIVTKVRNFLARRNDIAHSIVRPLEWIIWRGNSPPSVEMRFCSVPPHYTGKKFTPQDLPIYVYTSVEMRTLSTALFYVCQEVVEFKWKLILDERVRRQEPSWQGSKPRIGPTEAQ